MDDKYGLDSETKKTVYFFILIGFISLFVFSISGTINFLLLLISVTGAIFSGLKWRKHDNISKAQLLEREEQEEQE